MSVGVWGLLAFSFFSGTTAIIQAAKDGLLGTWWGARWLARWPQRLIAMPGIISGVFLGSYTGVLLAATSIPVWSRSKMLGAVFIASYQFAFKETIWTEGGASGVATGAPSGSRGGKPLVYTSLQMQRADVM